MVILLAQAVFVNTKHGGGLSGGLFIYIYIVHILILKRSQLCTISRQSKKQQSKQHWSMNALGKTVPGLGARSKE